MAFRASISGRQSEKWRRRPITVTVTSASGYDVITAAVQTRVATKSELRFCRRFHLPFPGRDASDVQVCLAPTTKKDRMPKTLQLDFMLGLPLDRKGPTYTAASLASAMDRSDCVTHIYTPLDRWPAPALAVPITSGAPVSDQLLSHVPYRVTAPLTVRLAERSILAAAPTTPARQQIVYMWGEVSLRLATKLAARGTVVVREKINCGKQASKRILDEAYGRLGVAAGHSITDSLIAKEHEELHLADAVFCPNQMVAESLREIGLPSEKLIATSYGWEPERFIGDDRALGPIEGTTFLFVGFLCVRKGAHILLDAWQKAGVNGRLIIAGKIEPLIAERYAHVLDQTNVNYIPFTPNVGALYRAADWFIFPSLEEGGPQVTYEAGGCGVPGLVSRMGGGAFTRDGVDGTIIDSDDCDVWAAAIASAASTPELRRAYGENARRRAEQFNWAAVGAQRREALIERYAMP